MQPNPGQDKGQTERRPSEEKDGIVFWSRTERGVKAELRLQQHPYDTESWGVLTREAQGLPLETARVLYERLVRRFPNCGRYWRLYIEQEVVIYDFGKMVDQKYQ